MKYTILAPAKVNLYLDVLSKREDGYHEIESIMQSISLCDKISIDISESSELKISIDGTSDAIAWDEKNLAYKACKIFANEAKITNSKIDIFVEKNIPISAGMAGGSTDAGGVLILLNKAFAEPFSRERLCELGARLGADVPFCIVGGTYLCKGVGEVLLPLAPFKDKLLVCAIDSSSVSTPVAYGMLDKKYGTDATSSSDINAFLAYVKNDDLKGVSSSLFNKFESVIIPENPSILKIKDLILENGALGALMSGSGPSVFGIFENENDQKRAFDALQKEKIQAFLCKTL
jgi:4-diphosphocytidyl-2-C-methyl-D-erythritol kinase